jgi:hypothetical protein
MSTANPKQTQSDMFASVLSHFDMLDTKPLVDLLRRFDDVEPLLYAKIANAIFDAHRLGQGK